MPLSGLISALRVTEKKMSDKWKSIFLHQCKHDSQNTVFPAQFNDLSMNCQKQNLKKNFQF